MSNKAKKAKQAKLRKQQQVKQLNRVRGQVKNFNLSDEEAAFYKRALTNKSTPAEFITETANDLRELLNKFDLIIGLAAQPDWMATIEGPYPEEHKAIKGAAEYLQSALDDLRASEVRFVDEFQGMDNSNNSFLLSSPAMEVFGSIQENIEQNAENLIKTMQMVIELYADLEEKYPGVENDDN